MGLLPKYKIEELKRQKKEAKAAKKRKENVKSKIVRFLIVCEGERTEPQYFKSLLKNKYSKVIEYDVAGEGMSTCALVNKTLEIKDKLEKKNNKKYDSVWVVFDKDDFQDFNEAIALAEDNSFKTAWSNESFELWYFLHFQFLDTAIDRHAYIEKLQDEIRKHKGFEKFVYKKNDPQFYNVLQQLGNEKNAKKFAANLRKAFINDKDYKNHKPCTKVDLLVKELEEPEKLLK